MGTPPVLSLAAIEPGLDIILDAGINNLRNKSAAQSEFLVELINEYLIPLGFTLGSPTNPDNRGSHISIQHSEGYRINRAMIEPGNKSKVIIPDFRPPDNIRLGIAPLYNSFIELYESVIRIRDIVNEKEYLNFFEDSLKHLSSIYSDKLFICIENTDTFSKPYQNILRNERHQSRTDSQQDG